MLKNIRVVILFLFLIAFLARIIPGARTIDDAYITFRYARNMLAGEGFVYNHGEHVQGTTTPLYSFLMVGLGFLDGRSIPPFPQIALVVNALADGITCALLFLIGKQLRSPIGGAAAGLAWSIAPFSVAFAVGGLETSVYVFLLTACMWAHLSKYRKTAAILAVMALLTRPDAILLVAPILIHRLYQSKFPGEKITLAELGLFLAPGIAWGIFAWIYFGSPVPHSVQAKLEVYRLEPLSSLIRLIQHYALIFMQDIVLGPIVGTALGLLLAPFLFILGGWKAFKENSSILPYFLYPVIYLVVFSLPNPLIFRWYLTPPMPALYLFILIGAHTLLEGMINKIRLKSKKVLLHQIAGILIIITPFLLNLNGWELHPDHGANRPAPGMAWIKLELLYQEAASLVSPMMTGNTLLAAGDVGVLGYYTPAKILDTVGLNSPQSLQYYPISSDEYVINYAIPTRLILGEEPDWIVVLEVYARNTFLDDKVFNRQYELWKMIPTDIYGSKGLLIFQKMTNR
ncbi:MAG: hypothetical protein IT308_06675 [Anaerolineaceae bacterium]|nr:hypothetical protein [Anaerolineaceae bacterium]